MTLTEIFKQVIFNNSFLRPCFTISKKKCFSELYVHVYVFGSYLEELNLSS